MEMEKISPDPETSASLGEGTSGTAVKTGEEAETGIYAKVTPTEDLYSDPLRQKSTKKKTGEEETDVYAKLTPTEDLYSDPKSLQGAANKKKEPLKMRLWRGLSVFLGTLCLILLLVVIVLFLKQREEVTPPKPVFLNGPRAFRTRCQSPRCDEGWLESGQSCFLLATNRKTWPESKTFCEGLGGSLAVITDDSVQKFLTEKGNLPYWIGLSKDQRVWTWVDGQHLTGNSFWSDSHPGAGGCVLLDGTSPDDKSWSKSPCTRPTYYICQKPTKNIKA